MFKQTVCYIKPSDGGYSFTVQRGGKKLAEGITFDGIESLKTITGKLVNRKINKFVLID